MRKWIKPPPPSSLQLGGTEAGKPWSLPRKLPRSRRKLPSKFRCRQLPNPWAPKPYAAISYNCKTLRITERNLVFPTVVKSKTQGQTHWKTANYREPGEVFYKTVADRRFFLVQYHMAVWCIGKQPHGPFFGVRYLKRLPGLLNETTLWPFRTLFWKLILLLPITGLQALDLTCAQISVRCAKICVVMSMEIVKYQGGIKTDSSADCVDFL